MSDELESLRSDVLPRQVYETLRARGPLQAEQLRSCLGVSQERLTSALDDLCDLRMVRPDPQDRRITALPTGAALRELLRDQRDQLDAALEDVLRRTATVDRVLRDYPLRFEGEQAEPPVTVLTERSEIEQFLTDLAETATSTLESMHPGPLPSAEMLSASLAKDRRLLSRGVVVRSLYPTSFPAATRLRRYFQDAAEAGSRIRLSSHVPVDLLIADRREVVLPLDVANPGLGICILHGGPVVQAFVSFFECFWLLAAPPSAEAPGQSEAPLGDQQLVLLKLLAGGMKDERIARVLGVSPRTLSRLISELMAILEAESRFEAGVKAARRGWLG
ncbi:MULTISPECIES: LuxR C-terminal-related transcriptional regulator [Streptomyces]|uniref:LuxR C-terminal-related transcriptional regulator n=1 Tax=Streptomyces herbicida TaxID=3065675 RepID=UPI00293133AB|nr:LuxR C-terminal-related transcriptional regulator [Streptomyces sp. NEAU-HV9]